MAELVSKSKFKPRSLEYFRKIEESGEDLIITDHGRPVLKIIPYSLEPPETLRILQNTVVRYERPADPVDGEEWEALE